MQGTLYSINWLPFGGFVKIKGEGGEHEEDQDSFSSKPFWRRSTILLAGVFMNIVLTIVLLSAGFTIGIPQAIEGLESYAKVKDRRIELVDVFKDGPAARAGLRIGDIIIRANNLPLASAEELREYLQSQEGNFIKLNIRRDGRDLAFEVKAENLPGLNKFGVGVFLLDTGLVSYPWYISIWKGVLATGFLIKEILLAFGNLLKNLILTGKVAVDLSGPVGIAVLTGRVARLGFAYLLQFTAILSVNLAILNALPIPALDGGRFLFLVIEKLRKKPVSRKIESIIHNTGFFLLILLVLAVTYRDLLRYSDQILRALRLK